MVVLLIKFNLWSNKKIISKAEMKRQDMTWCWNTKESETRLNSYLLSHREMNISHYVTPFMALCVKIYFNLFWWTVDRGQRDIEINFTVQWLEAGLVSGEVTCPGDSQQMMTGTRTRSDKLWLHATILKGPNQPPIMYNKTIKITIKVQGR